MQSLSNYHSGYDEYGFRISHIFPILEKYGISLSSDNQQKDESSQPEGPCPWWKSNLAKRNNLTIFEASCALTGVDPFSEAEVVERFGAAEAAYDMNRALLDDAIDEGLIKSFEKKTNGNHTQTFVNARDFALWCDSINLARPLPWDFDRTAPSPDVSSQHELTELRKKLAEADKELQQLRKNNENLAAEVFNGLENEEIIAKLKAENDRLRGVLSSQQPVSDRGLSFRYETEMLKLVSEVQEKFLGVNYDSNDSDTRPRKDSVVEWLIKENKNLSKASAEAIDRIAMPFNRAK